MAQSEAPAEAEAPKKKSKLLIIIIAVVLVLVVGGGAVAYLLLSGGDKKAKKHAGDEEVAAEEEGGDEHADDAHPPVYQKLETFTVNLSGQDSYLQTEIQLKLADAKVGEKLNTHMPEIRDAVIRLLSKKTPEELNAPDGKDMLAEEILKGINEVLGYKKNKGVKKVLFAAFIIQ